MGAVGDWVVLLLGPFLVIGAGAVIAAVITLAIRSRRQWSMRPKPPAPEHDHPVDKHHPQL